MGACKHAEPLGWVGWRDEHDKPLTGKALRAVAGAGVSCAGCGWRGVVADLHNCGDTEGDCSETLWCPQCGTSGWTYD